MTHPLIDQLRFTRREWLRGLEAVSDEDAARHFGPMNCISWTVGHLAWHEQRSWLQRAQGQVLFPRLNEEFRNGAPMTTPVLSEMLELWRQVTAASESYLDGVTVESLQQPLPLRGQPASQSIGSVLQRLIYHYWYHLGEIQAIRQMSNHPGLPAYVGDLEKEAPYRPEA
jgi:hypothetical protein